MKKIIEGVLFDTQRAQKIIEVEAGIGNRKMYKTLNGNFFTLENDLELVPMTKQEAIDFLRIHQPKIDALKFKQILAVHFGLNERIVNPLKGSLKVAETSDEVLHLSQPGRQFLLAKNGTFDLLTIGEALEWVEENQNEIPDLDKVLKLYFPTIKRA
jgi:hypothetical protein